MLMSDIEIGVDWIIAECARSRLDGVAGCICIWMSDLWVVAETEASGCTARDRGERNGACVMSEASKGGGLLFSCDG